MTDDASSIGEELQAPPRGRVRGRVPAAWITARRGWSLGALKKGARRLENLWGRRRVPGVWISPSSPYPRRCHVSGESVLSRGRFSLVKPSNSGSERTTGPPERQSGDIDLLKFTTKPLPRYTPPLHFRPGDHDNQLLRSNPRCRVYPTNGNAGGKLPKGKPGLGSPRLSFSAAVR